MSMSLDMQMYSFKKHTKWPNNSKKMTAQGFISVRQGFLGWKLNILILLISKYWYELNLFKFTVPDLAFD